MVRTSHAIQFLVLALVFAFFMGFTRDVWSQEAFCGNDRTKIVNHLASEYFELRIGLGLDSSGRVVEIYTSKQGTWTIIVTFADGRVCMVASGTDWQASEPIVTGSIT